MRSYGACANYACLRYGRFHFTTEMHLNLWEVSDKQDLQEKGSKVSVLVNGCELQMLIDTGSPVSIVSRDMMVPGLDIRPSQLKLKSFTGRTECPECGLSFLTARSLLIHRTKTHQTKESSAAHRQSPPPPSLPPVADEVTIGTSG
ncbi:hypothetical protein FJT64_005554 [Amphibalanus amphitrite]|uniref:C2H2-type domain-containing protein n=1 Tax=Amphibalanus amphitrite TaxID=1232801 RepID=A0A6A4W073_AMPAM|nr:hypothetical protein FJT64_005554 [Amphibalanus amphitrite]